MRNMLLVILLSAGLATAPGYAASSAALPYDLKLSSPLGVFPHTSQVQSGSTFGGVPVTGSVAGTSSSGTLNLYADGKLFASGTYSCASTCNFTGTVAGKSVTGMQLTTSSHVNGVGKATSGVFPNHGAWVSAVGDWAKANLNGKQRGEVVSAAGRIEGSQASGSEGGHGKGKGKP